VRPQVSCLSKKRLHNAYKCSFSMLHMKSAGCHRAFVEKGHFDAASFRSKGDVRFLKKNGLVLFFKVRMRSTSALKPLNRVCFLSD
jgi:hypothetical protein